MLGRRKVMSGWADDPVWEQDGWQGSFIIEIHA